MKQKYLPMYMEIAETIAKQSVAKRLQVGSIIVNDSGRILSMGFNGMPSGWDNTCEYYEENNEILITKAEVLHSEANSILKCAKDGQSTNSSTMFCTHSPCLECSKLIHQAGIKTVYYRNKYRDDSGIEFLKKCNIIVEQI